MNKILIYVIAIVAVGIFALPSAYSHEHEHENEYSETNFTNVTNVTTTVNKTFEAMPSVQYQFNPDSSKYQLSIGASTSEFNGNNAFGIALGKRLCDSKCNGSFYHGGLTTNGEKTKVNMGVTFSWD